MTFVTGSVTAAVVSGVAGLVASPIVTMLVARPPLLASTIAAGATGRLGAGGVALEPVADGASSPTCQSDDGSIDQPTARTYHQLMNDIASMLVLSSQNSFDVMCAIEDGEITVPEQLFFGFGEQQDRLNKLLQNRATLKLSVETGLDVADKLAWLVRELKKCKIE